VSTVLQLDVGNSSAKWRLVRAGEVVTRGHFSPGDEASGWDLFDLGENPEQVLVASVSAPATEARLLQSLRDRWQLQPWLARSQAVTGDLRNSYEEPSRMGVDRWLAMLAARQRCRGRVCVVDAGSALTIDFIDADGSHQGGFIIPGPLLMERALLLDTDRVRFAEDVDYDLQPGRSTAEAVRHGIALSQAGALRLALAQPAARGANLLFCGGGGESLMALADCGGELHPDLVFEGLQLMHDMTA
jgi:type III pantothenate kinase